MPRELFTYILCRGLRLSELFAQISMELQKKGPTLVTLGTPGYSKPFEGVQMWGPSPSLPLFDLPTEVQKLAHKARKQPTPFEIQVQEIEKKLGMTAYHAASNYLTYRRFSLDYYKHWPRFYNSEEEILNEFVGSYCFFTQLFKSHPPKLLFCETPDIISHRVACALALSQGVFTIANNFIPTMGRGRTFLVTGSTRRNLAFETFLKKPSLISEDSKKQAQTIVSNLSQGKMALAKHIENYRKKSHQAVFIQVDLKTRKLKDLLHSATLRRVVSRKINLRWIGKHFQTSLPKTPYILYPMHHQPEAATNLVAPRWIDQDRIIELLATHAPCGMKIVVKENPKTLGYRGRRYFEPLLRLPNVHLLHSSVSMGEVVYQSRAVVTIAGTTGLEAYLMGKPVGVLSDCFYSIAPGIWRLDSPEQIFDHLLHQKPLQTPHDIALTAQALFESSYLVGEGIAGTPWPEPVIGGKRFAQSILDYHGTLQTQNLSPRDFDIRP